MGASAEVLVAHHRSAQGWRTRPGDAGAVDSRAIESLPDVKVPTLVLVGENDTPFIKRVSVHGGEDPWREARGDPERGHAANIDQQRLFNSAVLEFLGGLNLA